MHELSIALSVCQMAEDRLGRAGLRQVKRIGLTVGEDAGIELGSLEFCLDVLLHAPPFDGAKAEIARKPGADLLLDYLEVDDAR